MITTVGPSLQPRYVSKWVNATLFAASPARPWGIDEVKLKVITSTEGPQIRWLTHDAIPEPSITYPSKYKLSIVIDFTEQARNLLMPHKLLVCFQGILPCDTPLNYRT